MAGHSFSHFIFFAAIAIIVFVSEGCKKKAPPPLSPDKDITIFAFYSTDNPGVFVIGVPGKITDDSVIINVPMGTNVTKLTPAISVSAKATVSPASGTSQNFSVPLKYVVTAENGSTKSYTVVARYLDTTKVITSFVFKASDNAGVLSKDVIASINNDTIIARLPSTASLKNLTPTITYKGQSLSPAGNTIADFSTPKVYTVFAEDGTSRNYTVKAGPACTLYFGSTDTYLYSVDGASGKLHWKYKTGGRCKSTPCIYADMVITGSTDGFIYAVDTATGNLRWKRFASLSSTPLVANDILFVPGSPYFYALNPKTGAVLWTGFGAAYGSFISPTAKNGVVYTNCYGDDFFAFEATTGKVIWRAAGGLGAANPVFTDSMIYTASELAQISAKDIKTGEQKWAYRGYNGITNPTIANNKLFLQTDSGFCAFNLVTHGKSWLRPNVFNSTPKVVGNSIYVLDQTSNTAATRISSINVETGAITGGFPLAAANTRAILTNITVSADNLYVIDVYSVQGDNSSYPANISSINRFTGQVNWTFTTQGSISGAPLIVYDEGFVDYPGNSGMQN